MRLIRRRHKIIVKTNAERLLDRAVAAKTAAIEIYNKVDFPYRAESFCILAVNGWELLLKAKWVKENSDDIESLYDKDKNTQEVKKNRSGNPTTIGINKIAKTLFDDKTLDKNVYRNLELLLVYRNNVTHFFNSSDSEFASQIQGIDIACVKNFVTAAQNWFDYDFTKFNFYLIPISFIKQPQPTDSIKIGNHEKNFLAYISQVIADTENSNDSDYAVTMNYGVKLMRSNNADAFPVRTTKDPNDPALRVTEEQIFKKFSWTYSDLIRHCKKRYKKFTRNRVFHEHKNHIRKNNSDVYKIRYLNPNNEKGTKQGFYSPEVLKEFDKFYTKK